MHGCHSGPHAGKPSSLLTEPSLLPSFQVITGFFPSLSSTINLKVISVGREGTVSRIESLLKEDMPFSWNVPRAQVTKEPISKEIYREKELEESVI